MSVRSDPEFAGELFLRLLQAREEGGPFDLESVGNGLIRPALLTEPADLPGLGHQLIQTSEKLAQLFSVTHSADKQGIGGPSGYLRG